MPQVWNLPTVGEGLPAVAEMLYRRKQDAERQRVLANEDARRSEEFGMRKEEFGLRKQQFEAGQTEEAEKRKARADWEELQRVKAMAPAEQDAWAAKIIAQDPRLAGVPTKRLIESIEPVLTQRLGIRETPGQLYRTAEGYLPADQAVGKMPYDEPPSYAPVRPQLQVVTDEQGRQYTIDVNSANPTPRPLVTGRNVAGPRGGWVERERPMMAPPRGSDRPQIINDGAGGAYEVVQGAGGRTSLREVPVEGGGGSGQLPEGVPPGSRIIGTSGGKPVYETPDGRRLIVE